MGNLEMRHASTRDLYAHWDGMRGDRAAPERKDIDPVAIRGSIGDTFMLELADDGIYRFGLSGERVNALFGLGLRDKSFVSLWPVHEQGEISSLCANVCDEALPIVAGLEAAADGRTAAALELLLLPLRYNGKTHSRILGTVSAARFPAWLGRVPVARLSLVSMRIVTGTGNQRKHQASSVSQPRRSGAVLPAAGHVTPIRQRGHLTVYEGGK